VFAKKQQSLPEIDLSALKLLVDGYDREALRDFCRSAIPEHLLDVERDEDGLEDRSSV
jgi:hypothetical protein